MPDQVYNLDTAAGTLLNRLVAENGHDERDALSAACRELPAGRLHQLTEEYGNVMDALRVACLEIVRKVGE